MNKAPAAEKEVRRLYAVELRLFDNIHAAHAAIVAADADLAAAALAGGAPLDTGALTAAQASLRAADAATNEIRRQRGDAIPALNRCKAADLRDEAERLRAEADKRQQKTDKLLAELEAHEECPYGPGIVAHTALDARPVFGTPRTRRLVLQADALDEQAVEFDRRPVNRTGNAAGATVAEVLAAAQADPFSIAPRFDVLELAAQELEAAERARRAKLWQHNPDFVAPDAPLEFLLAWRDGVVSDAESSCTTPVGAAA